MLLNEFIIDPKELGITANNKNNLKGKNAQYNAIKIIEIFKGNDNDFSKSVCLNAAAGLIVSEKHNEFSKAYNDAREHILSGNAFKHLTNIQNG